MDRKIQILKNAIKKVLGKNKDSGVVMSAKEKTDRYKNLVDQGKRAQGLQVLEFWKDKSVPLKIRIEDMKETLDNIKQEKGDNFAKNVSDQSALMHLKTPPLEVKTKDWPRGGADSMYGEPTGERPGDMISRKT